MCVEFYLPFNYLAMYQKIVLELMMMLPKLVLSANFPSSLLMPFSGSFMTTDF